jgi:hypothetical protein
MGFPDHSQMSTDFNGMPSAERVEFMKFRSTSSSAPYLNRRDQYRLLTLVAMLSMVMVAANMAKNPKNWYWLTGPPIQQPSKSPATVPQTDDDRDPAADVKTANALADDEFVSPISADESDDRPEVSSDDVEAQVLPAHRRGGDVVGTGVVTPLEPELLRPIKDNMILIQQREAEVYYEVFRRLKTYSDDAMERAAEKGFIYPVIMAQPGDLRGRILSVEGELERLTPLAEQEETHELGPLYEAWLFTRESGNNPIRVVCLNTEGLMPSEQFSPRPRVRFAGYFFKLYGYETQFGELHKAPLFLARGIQKTLGTVSKANEPEIARYVFGVLAVFGVVFMATVAYLTLSDRGPRRRHRERAIAARPEEIDALKNIETFDVSEMLKRLSDESVDESELESTPPLS